MQKLGSLVVLIKGLKQPTSLVVDAEAFYFTTRGTDEKKYRDGAVMKKMK